MGGILCNSAIMKVNEEEESIKEFEKMCPESQLETQGRVMLWKPVAETLSGRV